MYNNTAVGVCIIKPVAICVCVRQYENHIKRGSTDSIMRLIYTPHETITCIHVYII